MFNAENLYGRWGETENYGHVLQIENYLKRSRITERPLVGPGYTVA